MPEQPPVPRDSGAVARICSALHRAYRDLRFYPPNHPVAQQSLDALARVLLAFIRQEGSLTLRVEESRLVYDEDEVYSHLETRDNLAFIMFRDGLRAITFQSGLEQSETESFVDCLARADDLVRSEQDLVTVFWEQDFEHIDYQAADPFLSGGYLREGTVDALRDTVMRRLDEVGLERNGGETPRRIDLEVVPTVDLRPEMLALTTQELEKSERVAEEATTVLDDFAVVLLEMMGGLGKQLDDAELISRSVAAVLEAYLQVGDLNAVNFLLSELEKLEASGKITDGLLGTVVSQAVSVETLRSLSLELAVAPPERVALIEGFLGSIRQWVFAAQLELLAASPDMNVRRSLLAVLRKEGGVPAKHLEPWLRDPRWYVARNAAQLAAASRDPCLVVPLTRLLRHPEARVRREATHTLEGFGGEAALAGLTCALEDSDPTMRILAARGIAQVGGSAQEDLVAAQVLSRDFETRSPEEVEAMVLAYAKLFKERAVPFLDKLWHRRFLRPRPLAVRLAAIQALAGIPGELAHGSLAQASKSGEVPVRRAAARALQSVQSSGAHRS